MAAICNDRVKKLTSMENKIAMSSVKKVVLAYSGGLDTSVILRWLQDEYQCEVVTFTADLGQGEEVEPARAKASLLGVKEIYICLLYTSPSPRDRTRSRMPSSA